MENEQKEFDVERIVKRKHINGKITYLVKWVGFDQCTWEPECNMNCPKLLKEFKRSLAHKILGVKILDNVLVYMVKYKDSTIQSEIIEARKAKKHFAKLVFDFLESKIEWINWLVIIEPGDLREDGGASAPQKITYATKLRGEVMYWCVWPDSSGKFLSSQAVKDESIQLAIEFFESIVMRILRGEHH